MTALSLILDMTILAGCLLAGLFSLQKKNYVVGLLFFSVVFRGAISAVLQTGIQYRFVWDSLKYEGDAWLLAKSWAGDGGFEFQKATGYDLPNSYSYFMAAVYYIFGRDPFLLNVINGIISAFSMWALLPVIKRLSSVSHVSDEHRKAAEVFFIVAATLYPSLTVWSATNTKDPITVFFAAVTLNGVVNSIKNRGLSALIFLAGLAGVFAFRPYWAAVLVSGSVIGALYYGTAQRLGALRALAIFGLFGLMSPIIWSILFSGSWETAVLRLQENRLAFANFMLDDSAKSSFLLNFDYSNPLRFLLFWGLATIHYFLAPFPWDIRSSNQVLGFIEVLLILFVVIRLVQQFRRDQFDLYVSSILGGIFLSLVFCQSLVISNMGTIFRHRSLAILILLIFASIVSAGRRGREET